MDGATRAGMVQASWLRWSQGSRECLLAVALLGAAVAGVWATGSVRDGARSSEASDLPELSVETPCVQPGLGDSAVDRFGAAPGAGDGCDGSGGADHGGGPQVRGRGSDDADGSARHGRAMPDPSFAGPGAPASTTTTAGDDGGPREGPSTTTTALELRERNAPRVSGLRAGGEVPDGADQIFDAPACGSTSTSVEAIVVDQSRISAVTLHWSFGGARGQVTGSRSMSASGGRYTGVLGPFPSGTAPRSSSLAVRWWVEAMDEIGNVGRADAPDGSQPLSDDERVVLAACPS